MSETQYEHVHPELRSYLKLPSAERITLNIRIPFANYPLADRHLKRLLHYATMPQVDRMPCGLIFGPSNNGKTTILGEFGNLFAKQTLDAPLERKQAWVRVLAPPHADEARLCMEVLTALNAPLARTSTAREVSTDAQFHLRSSGVQLLLIDEFQHLITGTKAQVRVAMNAVKNISTKLQICIVGCGLPTAFNAIHSDPQVENRFYPMELPAWSYGDDFKQLLIRLEARLLLREPSNLSSAVSARVIHTRTDGLIGEAIALLAAASKFALQEGRECITGKDLSSCEYLGPGERRKRFMTQ